jgi:16S rRNA (adenine1518-N6/adenine1519-N6)-dimethyltransferase
MPASATGQTRPQHRARKRFGQNFLVDRNVVRRIVDSLDLRRDDRVVEIGPGLGALTVPLLDRLDRLDVVELDRDLAARLLSDHPAQRLMVHEADALRFDFGRLGVGLRIVGNLPYNISTPLLFHLASYAARLRDITVMLQKEVVERMVAAPGTPEYGRLSVMLQYRFGFEKLFDVPPGAFRPVPQVRSAVVRLTPRPAGELGARDEALFGRIVQAAFGQRRKMLRNTLEAFLGESEIAALAVDPAARGETLAVADYVCLANWCEAHGRPGRSPLSSSSCSC